MTDVSPTNYSPVPQEKRSQENLLSSVSISTVVIVGSIIGSAYVGNYRLGKIEDLFSNHQEAGHVSAHIESVKMQSEIDHIKYEFNRLRARVRVLEDDQEHNAQN